MVPEALEALNSEERHRVYNMLRLKVIVRADASVEVSGVFAGPIEVGELESVKTEGTSTSVLTDAR
jgi:hypothetical protein